MGSLTPLVLVVLFWLVVHLRYRRISSHKALLPTTTFSHELSSNKLCDLGRQTEVLLTSPVILRAETTIFNDAHSRLLLSLSRLTNPWGNVARRLYDCGSALAVCGQLFGLGALIWSTLHLWIHLFSVDPSVSLPGPLLKRGATPSSSAGYIIRPLIPGLTLPLSHLPHILFSFVGCTAIHELGHALVAAADGVSLLSWGYSLILVIPLAFVKLSANSHLPPLRQRLRIAAAGAYHNIITFVLLSVLALTSGSIWGFLGYQILESGVVVTDVQADSPLRTHLFPGSLITRLDDVSLAAPSPSILWKDILLGERIDNKGWCVETDWFNEHARSCCSSSITDKGSCFGPHPATLSTSGTGHCIDPLPLFGNKTISRCDSSAECGTGHICVAADSSAALLRIFIGGEKDREKDRVVVWKGPRREIWEQVAVGRYVPRARFFPLSLPGNVSLLLYYMKTTSLSLFFFNLLPVRALDGGEVISALLEARLHRDFDLEAGWVGRRARRVPQILELVTLVLVGVVGVGGLIV